MACSQLAPNGYTCLDAEWSAVGAGCAVVLFVAVVFVVASVQVDNVDAMRRRLFCARDGDVVAVNTRRRRQSAWPFISGGGGLDGMDIENHKLHPMEVYERELNDEQLYWVGLVQWLKWRWAWDGLRVLGFLLLLVRVVDAYGVNTWGAYGGDMPMWLALAPFLLLDGVALKVLVQSRYYPLFQGEDMSLKFYTVLAGFPCGTVFKILAIVEYDGDVNVQASAYWIVVLIALFMGVIDILHAAMWRNSNILGTPVQILILAALAYICLTFANFFRVAWPGAAEEADMREGSYEYDKGIWAILPSENWAEASICWWILFGSLVAIVWADMLLTTLPTEIYENEAFEVVRKVPVFLSTTGVALTAIFALYWMDTEWTTHNRKAFGVWVGLPVVVAEAVNLVFLFCVWIYTIQCCPDIVWDRRQLLLRPALDRESTLKKRREIASQLAIEAKVRGNTHIQRRPLPQVPDDMHYYEYGYLHNPHQNGSNTVPMMQSRPLPPIPPGRNGPMTQQPPFGDSDYFRQPSAIQSRPLPPPPPMQLMDRPQYRDPVPFVQRQPSQRGYMDHQGSSWHAMPQRGVPGREAAPPSFHRNAPTQSWGGFRTHDMVGGPDPIRHNPMYDPDGEINW
eukprot:m.30413 g.30413  ORF g.30413 m.30413 type:complete len:623 (+) comp4706_c0_seq1:73-1941(+)